MRCTPVLAMISLVITPENAGAVSGHKNGDCRIRGGLWDGCTLGQLWKEHRELFGGEEGDQFPILIKLIDARQDLSIQVHPDDVYAREHENGSLGKTECWYILDCEPGTEIIIGHNASSKEELKQMIDEGRWKELLRTHPIHRGDFFQMSRAPFMQSREERCSLKLSRAAM